ncbi:hypothetical protein evm_015558, partial [Chilo suppressalis]
ADPRKCEENSSSAWHMAKDKPLIREVMKACSAFTVGLEDDDIKSEPEDEFESADESEIVDSGLAELSQYSGEVCAILDASEGWRRLADRLQLQTLHSWYANTSSPARTLLHHLKVTPSSSPYQCFNTRARAAADAALLVSTLAAKRGPCCIT